MASVKKPYTRRIFYIKFSKGYSPTFYITDNIFKACK